MITIMIKGEPECTCMACPTIFEFKDINDVAYYFRLRHGHARIGEDDSNKESIVSGSFGDKDGVCCWDEAVSWAKENGVLLVIPEVEKEKMINYLFNKSGEWEWASHLTSQPYEYVLQVYNQYKEEHDGE